MFRAGAELTQGQIARAAATFAEAHAPFAETGSLLLRSPAGAAIWYWDRARLGAHGDFRAVSPESVWKSPGDGWRVLACAEGFEAQYWQDKALIASSWRREPFTKEQWAAFVLSVDAAAHEAPETPPAALVLERCNRDWRRALIKAPLGWRDAKNGALTIALCAGALAAFFSGQALRHENSAAEAQRAIVEVETRLRSDPDAARVRERLSLVRAYSDGLGTSYAPEAAVEALEIFHRLDLEVLGWGADAERFHALVAAPQIPVRDIVAALEQAHRLCGVTPEIGGAEGVVELNARVADETMDGCEPALRAGRS